jgi:hypothetical protein
MHDLSVSRQGTDPLHAELRDCFAAEVLRLTDRLYGTALRLTRNRCDAEDLVAGSVAIMPPGTPMFGYTKEDTVIQLHGVGPWGLSYLNPADDPRHKH